MILKLQLPILYPVNNGYLLDYLGTAAYVNVVHLENLFPIVCSKVLNIIYETINDTLLPVFEYLKCT